MKKSSGFDSDYNNHLLNVADLICVNLSEDPMQGLNLHSHLDVAEAISLIQNSEFSIPNSEHRRN